MKLKLFSATRFRDALAGHGMHVLDDDVLDPHVGEVPAQIAANAMVSNCVSALPVIDIYSKLVGIVSEGDLIRRVEIGTERRRSGEGETLKSSDVLAKEFVKSRAKRVSDVMTREVITAQPETPLREIANLMEKHSIKRVPIVRDELVVGIVSRVNLLQVLARANDNTDWVESDRVLHQRFVDSIKDQPWAGRPFNIVVCDRCADLWGFVYSVDEKTAVRVAAEATAGARRSRTADRSLRRALQPRRLSPPADVYFDRAEIILAERERIKRTTIANRRLQHQLQAA